MSTGPTARANAAGFLQMLLFDYLIAATDGHAKNYSILLDAGGARRLAPTYGAASIAPYVDPARWKTKPPKLAMPIGGENRVGRVSMNDLERMVDLCGLEKAGITADGCAGLLRVYAETIPGKLAEVFDDLEQTRSAPAAKELRERMERPVAEACRKAKTRLQGAHETPS